MSAIRRIVVTGPESTGKSTLCQQLAAHYNTVWCREYAREFLTAHGTAYNYNDLLTIAKGQVALETATINLCKPANELTPAACFIDTDLYVMKVWSEFVFNKCHNYILEQIAERKYDLYLLCNVDLPWEADPMREYPDEKPRQELYHIYKDILINQKTPWVEISGTYNQRLQTAIEAVDKLLVR
jgi:NadR type nicotinamide-nucleotide adenylyltransferase